MPKNIRGALVAGEPGRSDGPSLPPFARPTKSSGSLSDGSSPPLPAGVSRSGGAASVDAAVTPCGCTRCGRAPPCSLSSPDSLSLLELSSPSPCSTLYSRRLYISAWGTVLGNRVEFVVVHCLACPPFPLDPLTSLTALQSKVNPSRPSCGCASDSCIGSARGKATQVTAQPDFLLEFRLVRGAPGVASTRACLFPSQRRRVGQAANSPLRHVKCPGLTCSPAARLSAPPARVLLRQQAGAQRRHAAPGCRRHPAHARAP
jgi:hypothetical protein